MPSRPAITVLLLTRAKIHRADFASLSRSPEITERERADAPDIASTIESVLADGPLPGKRAFVLATDFWLQNASLPASRAAGMSEGEIAASLNFEAEVLSGLPALESAASIVPLPPAGGERRFLLLQIPFSVRDSLQRVLAERGSILGGIAHPAALPRAFGKSDLTLQRLELWPDLAVGMRPSQTLFDAQISNADPSTGRWVADLGEWSGEDVLIGPDIEAPSGVRAIPLEEDPRLATWFSAWAEELTSKKPRAALVQPPAKPTPAIVRVAVAAVFALAVVGLGYFHWTTGIKQPIQEAKARTAAAKDKSKQFADLQAREAEEKKKSDVSQQEAAKFEALAEQVESLQLRFSRLLQALAAEKPADVMIRSIEANGGEPKVLGTSLRPELADAYARSLSPLVRELGWDVQAPKKTAMKLTADGGPWSFEIEFHRLPEATSPKPKAKLPPGTVHHVAQPRGDSQ